MWQRPDPAGSHQSCAGELVNGHTAIIHVWQGVSNRAISHGTGCSPYSHGAVLVIHLQAVESSQLCHEACLRRTVTRIALVTQSQEKNGLPWLDSRVECISHSHMECISHTVTWIALVTQSQGMPV